MRKFHTQFSFFSGRFNLQNEITNGSEDFGTTFNAYYYKIIFTLTFGSLPQ